MPPVITDSNQEILTAIAEAIHTVSHDMHELVRIAREEAADIRKLREAWDDHGAVVRGFQAGGLLGARAARKATGNGAVH